MLQPAEEVETRDHFKKEKEKTVYMHCIAHVNHVQYAYMLMYRVSANVFFNIILKAIILKTIKSRSSMKRNGSGVEHNEFVKGRVSTKVNRCAACDRPHNNRLCSVTVE